MRRVVQIILGAIFALLLVFFWLIPKSQRNDLMTWIGLAIAGLCALLLSLAFYYVLRTWRGFAALLALHVAAQVWLQWQWSLWDASIVLVRNLNVVAMLIVFATLIAMFISLCLLLIYRDASVIALAVGWIGYPALLISVALRYHTLDRLNNAAFRDQMILIVPTCFLPFLLAAGGITFFAHLIRLTHREVTAKD